MCFIEYNWMLGVYQFRIGDRFTDFRGTMSLPSLGEWRDFLALYGCSVGAKTDSRTWRVECSLSGEG